MTPETCAIPGQGGVKVRAQESACSNFTFTSTQRQGAPSKSAIEAARGTSLQESGFAGYFLILWDLLGGDCSPENIQLDTVLICQVELNSAENL